MPQDGRGWGAHIRKDSPAHKRQNRRHHGDRLLASDRNPTDKQTDTETAIIPRDTVSSKQLTG
jgi:hypothetical protein